MEETVRYPRFISNGPCGKDLFAGQAHQRIAEEIAQQLLQPHGPHVIGLDGGWGAGKSNIIEIIRRKAQEKKKVGDVLFFTYNAWGHQGDPLRRSILEELTRCIVRSNTALTKKKKRTWKKNLNTLLSQRKEVSTKTFPKLSAGVIVFSLVILLTPVFNAIARALPAFLNQWTEGIVTATPILLALIYAVAKYCKFRRKKMNSRKKKKRSSFKSFLSELFYLYKGSVQETETHEEVYSSEATSTQFKDWIDKLDKALKARLVIVIIDDMDRLPARSVQELWAAIHTLFTEVKYERIKVIIPFDRSHIISAFREENIILPLQEKEIEKQSSEDSHPSANDDTQQEDGFFPTPPKQTASARNTIYHSIDPVDDPNALLASDLNNSISVSSAADIDAGAYYGNDVIDKIFDAVYRVSPPILTDWMGYLEEQWKKAFNEPPLRSITQIYGLFAKDNTPRKIVAFINECVAIKNSCSPKIPNEYIALFAMVKHQIARAPQSELILRKFCKSCPQYNSEETTRYLLALYYQLEPENALDIIYVNQLREELSKGENHLLQNLISKTTPSRLEHLLKSAIYTTGDIDKAIKAIITVPTRGDIPSGIFEDLSELIKFNSLINLPTTTPDFTTYEPLLKNRFRLLTLMDKEKACQHLKSMIGKIYKSLSIYGTLSAEKFYLTVKILQEVCSEVDYLHPLSHLRETHANGPSYIDFVYWAGAESYKYKILCNIGDIDDALCKRLRFHHEKFAPFIPCVAHMEYLGDLKLPVYQEMLRNRIGNITEVPMDVADWLIAWWIDLKVNDKELIPSDSIISLLNRSGIEERKALMPGLLCMLIAQGGAQERDWVNVYSKVSNGDYRGKRAIKLDRVISCYAEVLATFNLPLKEVLDVWSLFQYQDSITTETVPYIPAQFFVDTREFGQNELVQHCRETAIQYLNTLSKEEWEIAVREKNHAYELFTALQCDPPENGKEILA